MKKTILGMMVASSLAFGHTALMSCFDNGDGTVTCEGGFSDGSSANGVVFKVEQNGKAVVEGKFDADSEFSFKKPKGDYKAVLDAGEGHKVVVDSKNIVE